MIIYRSLRSNIQSQGFYENRNPIYKQLGMTMHGGIDWLAKDREPIYFDVDVAGIVLNTEIDNAGGKGINIITEDERGIFKHRYWHLYDFKVKAGDNVESGDLLGWADNTGFSTGTHLHRDAKEMLRVNGTLQIKEPGNGTFGTIDYANWFKNIFVLDMIENLRGQISLIQRIIKLLRLIGLIKQGK